MKREHEIAALLARHEQSMVNALEREEHYSRGPHVDRIAASNAASEHSESEAAALGTWLGNGRGLQSLVSGA